MTEEGKRNIMKREESRLRKREEMERKKQRGAKMTEEGKRSIVSRDEREMENK